MLRAIVILCALVLVAIPIAIQDADYSPIAAGLVLIIGSVLMLAGLLTGKELD